MESKVSRTVIEELVRGIEPPSEEWRQRARQRLDTLTKPLGSLGRLEDIAAQVAAIRGEQLSDSVSKAVYVFAADHGFTEEGVTEERVSAYPREVTRQMLLNFLAEGAAINVLARLHGAALHVVDVGVDADFGSIPGLLHHKVRGGTRNMLREAAMSEEEVEKALNIGYQLGSEAAAAGHTIIAIGEMGIGNTTAASAVTCALTGAAAKLATGRGTGVEPAAHLNKVRVVEAAVDKHCGSSARSEPREILRCIGGLEIAAMAGMVLAGARRRLVVVLDGFISTAAAALAVGMAPNALGYLIAGHRSEEPGHKLLLDHLQLTPVLSLGMRLGEGTGAVLAMPVIESAIALYHQMATFSSAGVSGAP
jgi:nicotinate-nucleotide--dimethylbenzimidazole phosphoribosyltransferase